MNSNIHASLNAEMLQFEPVVAPPYMEPYVLCWCNSGKKYKFCHYRRESQNRPNIFDLEKEVTKKFREGYCSLKGVDEAPCSPGVSLAHTVQRNGGLAAIAENQHVLSVKPAIIYLAEQPRHPIF